MRRITSAWARLVIVTAVVACQGNGSTAPGINGPACTSLQLSLNTNNFANCQGVYTGGAGGGGGGGGGGTGAPAALYRLTSVNGVAPPFAIANDSVVTTDSTHVRKILLDSSVISLNTDSTVTEIDYFYIHDRRFGGIVQAFDYTKPLAADTATGTWSDSTGQPFLTLTTGIKPFAFAGDSLYNVLAYTFIDSVGTVIPGQASFTYKNQGTPFRSVVATLRGSLSAASVRQASPGGAGLRFLRSNDRRRRLGRVVGQ